MTFSVSTSIKRTARNLAARRASLKPEKQVFGDEEKHFQAMGNAVFVILVVPINTVVTSCPK